MDVPYEKNGCGCCAREIPEGFVWCADCRQHITDVGKPWDRTYLAQYGRRCPFEGLGKVADAKD